ncbi:hypothetical protein AB0O07_23830 [Streptomyces sp. NPDC093085]|uniref:hypothetical protein n=1 Tax=Streptomyces sp. NPDC093085 TaxID=3155068 RepID=UPI00341C6DAE
MADERDTWLDKDAAERLLRGEPVEALDEGARARRERLSGALADISAVTYANDTELPGEAAALAAFRAAGAGGAAGAGATSATGGAGDPLGTVRLALAPGDVRTAGTARAARSGRRDGKGRDGRPGRESGPLRRGLIVAVAGCALGGITVAAGATVLPGLFSTDGAGPVSSISAGVSPKALPSGGRAATPSDRPSADGTTGREPSDPSGATGAPSGGVRGGSEDADAMTGEATDDRSGPFVPDADPGSGARYRRTLEACRDYRGGEIDPQRRKALDAAAGGQGGTERYCARLLDREPLDVDGRNSDGHGKDGHNGGDSTKRGGGSDRVGTGEKEGGKGESSGTPSSPNPAPDPTPTPTPSPTTTLAPAFGVPVPEESPSPESSPSAAEPSGPAEPAAPAASAAPADPLSSAGASAFAGSVGETVPPSQSSVIWDGI